MAGDRLTAANKRVLVLWVIAAIAGAVFAYKFYFRAFPEASVNFQVSREEVLTRAKQFVSGLGEDLNGYQSAIVFSVDDDSKTYLERNVGLEEANKLMSSQLNIWYWQVRFFKPEQKEEYSVRVNPAGVVVGYGHVVEEARAGKTLDRAAAQNVAETYLDSKLGMKSGWTLLPEEINSDKKPNRLDWSFTWEKQGFRAKDAPYRLRVGVLGDRVGGSVEFLQVPEAWRRSYAQLRSTNQLYNNIAIIPYMLLMGSAVWLGISFWRKGQSSWAGAFQLGAVVAALFFFMQLNQWQTYRAEYNTESSYSSFVTSVVLQNLLLALATALTVTLVLPGAEPLYRAAQPERLRLSKAFTRRGLQSKEFFIAAWVGLCLAAAHIGFIVAFYMVGSKVGVWAPQDLNYSEAVNTTFPWIAGVAIGMLASTSEEFLFRLFAIPFVHRLTKSRVLAVILPAFSWSFLHSAYPQEPAYTRGIEVGLIGIVAGIVMLRWGILATLIWHYTVDASLVGLLLVRSNNLYFKFSGVIVGAAAVAPLLFSAVAYLRRGQFEPVEDLLNAAAPATAAEVHEAAPSEEPEVVAHGRYEALNMPVIGALAVCLLLGGLLAARVKQPSIGDYLKLPIDAREAHARADAVMQQRGADPKTYRSVVLISNATDPITNEFLRERVGVAATNEIYKTEVPGALWSARYFRDSQPEEFLVVLRPDGSLHSVHHTIAEEAPGASLSKEEALAKAEAYLRDEKKIDLSQWSLVESKSDKKPHRLDHTLVWQNNRALDADAPPSSHATGNAYARMELHVIGDEVNSFRTYVKIPDEWRRQQREENLPRTLLSAVLPFLILGGLVVAVVIVFLKNLRSEEARAIPWRRLSKWGFWGLAGYIIIFVFGNRIATFLNAYQTEIPLKTMLAGIAIGSIIGAVVYFAGIGLLFGMAWYFGRRAFGEEQLPRWTGMPGAYYRDAFFIGLGGTAALVALGRIAALASAHWPTVHRAAEASFGGDFDTVLPAGSIFGSVLLRGLLYSGLVGVVAGFIDLYMKPLWMRLLLFLVAAMALVGADWGSAADFVKQFVSAAVILAVLIVGVTRVVRFNLLGYFLIAVCTSLLSGAVKLIGQPNSFYKENGYAVVAMLVLLLAWPLVEWLRAGSALAENHA